MDMQIGCQEQDEGDEQDKQDKRDEGDEKVEWTLRVLYPRDFAPIGCL